MDTVTTKRIIYCPDGRIYNRHRGHKEGAKYGKPSPIILASNNLGRYHTLQRHIYTAHDAHREMAGRFGLRVAIPEPFWEKFQQLLKRTVCSRAPTHQPAHYSISLDTPLGKWATVPQNIWFQCYQKQGAIYLRDDEYPMIKTFTKWANGFYNFDCDAAKVPLESYLCTCQHVREVLWT